MKRLLLGMLCYFLASDSSAQVVFQPVGSSVYEFVEELNQLKIIDINQAVKPYSRKLIASQLEIAQDSIHLLNTRQVAELEFFLKDFNKELKPDKNFKKRIDVFYYKDSLFTFTFNPSGNFRLGYNKTGTYYHRWIGAEFWGYIGKHFGFYASLRDNGISQALATPTYLTNTNGGNYKVQQGFEADRTDFSQMTGGISYSWKWGDISVVKDRFTWGNAYHGSNIFSGRNPTVPYLQLKIKPVKWAELNYIHAWLVSEVLDSARTYISGNSSTREVYHEKYLATNLITIMPARGWRISAGNSIIYSDMSPNLGFLNPLLFYKSVDHTFNGTSSNALGQNSQMFLDFSTTALKHFHFYSSLFVDELHIKNIFNKNLHTNLVSWKVGTRATNIIDNLSLIVEYTRTNAWAYRHPINTTTFASNQYNLGHYLGENAEEVFIKAIYKPLKNLRVNASYTFARKGPEGDFSLVRPDGRPNVIGTPFMSETAWQNHVAELFLDYEVINDAHVTLQYQYMNNSGDIDKYTPEFYRGVTNTILAGITVGF